MEALRDAIVEADLAIDTRRQELAAFDAEYHGALAAEHESWARLQGLLRHWQRLAEALTTPPELHGGGRHVDRLQARQHRSVRARATAARVQAAKAAAADGPDRTAGDAGGTGDDLDARGPSAQATGAFSRGPLKLLYRALARRYHPDLAGSEADQVRRGRLMVHINGLYRAGDLDRLQTLCGDDAALTGPPEPDEMAERLALAVRRRAWYAAVVASLTGEMAALATSTTGELCAEVEAARAAGADLVAEVRSQLREQIDRGLTDVAVAARLLEDAVRSRNQQERASLITTATGDASALRPFDAHVDRELIRLGQASLQRRRISPAARALVPWVEALPQTQPGLLDLLLLTYVIDLSPLPLLGLDSYEALALRYATLAAGSGLPADLATALLAAEAYVAYGLRPQPGRRAQAGLSFCDPALGEAIMVALAALPVRRAFRAVLCVVGEALPCEGCAVQVFAIPLYRLRGLDDLRGAVCPHCGVTLRSYWLPRGDDLQSVLNASYLDLDLVQSWTFSLARASVSLQLTERQAAAATLGTLRRRLLQDVFVRHGLSLQLRHLQLWNASSTQPLRDALHLEDLDNREIAIKLALAAPFTEADALEMVRHRIRTRFQDAPDIVPS